MSNGTPSASSGTPRTVTAVSAFEDQVFVVCNDGTLWAFNASQGKWHEMPPIPQPPAPPATTSATPAASTTTATPAASTAAA